MLAKRLASIDLLLFIKNWLKNEKADPQMSVQRRDLKTEHVGYKRDGQSVRLKRKKNGKLQREREAFDRTGVNIAFLHGGLPRYAATL